MTPYERSENAKRVEHEIAAQLGFYRTQLWWIDSFRVIPGNFYRFHVHGRNDMCGGEEFAWSVPSLSNRSYAFALRLID